MNSVSDEANEEEDTETVVSSSTLPAPHSSHISFRSYASTISSSRYDPVPQPIPDEVASISDGSLQTIPYDEAQHFELFFFPEQMLWYNSYGEVGEGSDSYDEDDDLIMTRVLESQIAPPEP